MIRTLFWATAAFLAGCAVSTAVATQYPSWLEMKPGYAEECQRAGKCTPMTDDEIRQIAFIGYQRAMERCGRSI